MSYTVLKGKRFSFVYNENEKAGTRTSKAHKKFASLEKSLTDYVDSGVSLWIENQICTPREVTYYCMKDLSREIIPEYVCDSDGNLAEIHFDVL